MTDIGIIGAGTAGLTAALYARRAGKSVMVLEAESFGGQITASPMVENYPGIPAVSGNEFASALMTQVMDLGAEVEMARVTGIRNRDGCKTVITEYGNFDFGAVIIATGVKHRHLGVDGEERLAGKGVSYCAICDGPFFKGKRAAVTGGGSTAIQDAIILSGYCSDVYLIHRRDTFRAEKKEMDKLLSKPNITILTDTVVSGIQGSSDVTGLSLSNVKTGDKSTLDVSGLFVAIGMRPDNEAFSSLVKLDESGYIRASEDCFTSCPGIFAAGDCRTKSVRQLTTAAADGAAAAIAACAYLD